MQVGRDMMIKPIRILATMVVSLGLGMSIPVLADAGRAGESVVPPMHDNFSSSQFKLDMILARRGDADAQYFVGNAYEEGRGIQKNLEQAFIWYSKAAKQNQYKAQYRLGYLYENGLGVKQDIKKAMEWYKQAAKSSHNQVRDRMDQQAFAHRKELMKRSLAAMKVQREKRASERKLAEKRAIREAARKKQQLAAARHKKLALAAGRKSATAMRVNIPDISNVILKNNWRGSVGAADFLPSNSTHCLRSSGSEIVCFSNQKQRIINSRLVTYTTKSILSGFKSDGTFHISYNYNVVQMVKASSHGLSSDPNGLKLQQGWQAPQLSMNCQTVDRVNLYCVRGSIRLHYHH